MRGLLQRVRDRFRPSKREHIVIDDEASVFLIANVNGDNTGGKYRGDLLHLTFDMNHARDLLRWETEYAGVGDDIVMFGYKETDIDLVIAPDARPTPIRITKVY